MVYFKKYVENHFSMNINAPSAGIRTLHIEFINLETCKDRIKLEEKKLELKKFTSQMFTSNFLKVTFLPFSYEKPHT